MPAKDKHSSLLRTFINCRRKKFYNITNRMEVTDGNKRCSLLWHTSLKNVIVIEKLETKILKEMELLL